MPDNTLFPKTKLTLASPMIMVKRAPYQTLNLQSDWVKYSQKLRIKLPTSRSSLEIIQIGRCSIKILSYMRIHTLKSKTMAIKETHLFVCVPQPSTLSHRQKSLVVQPSMFKVVMQAGFNLQHRLRCVSKTCPTEVTLVQVC